MDPIFWLGLSVLLVAVSIAAVLLTMLPALKELGRAAQGAEKLFDTLNRELPPTLEAIRLTSLELTELTDEMSEGVQTVGQVAQQVDSSVTTAKKQTKQVAVTTKSIAAGFKAAWQTLTTEETVGSEIEDSEAKGSEASLDSAPSDSTQPAHRNNRPSSDRPEVTPAATRAAIAHEAIRQPTPIAGEAAPQPVIQETGPDRQAETAD